MTAHLRREERYHTKTQGRFSEEMMIDYGKRKIYIKGSPVELSNKEFEIIKLLSRNAGQVFDKERIYEHIWGFNAEGDCSVIKEHIRKIRIKFAEYTDKTYIDTVWGVGYRWKKLNGMIQKMSLKKALLSISAVSIILVAALSVMTIFLLLNLNQKILNTRPITIRNSDIQYEAGEKEEGDSLQYIVKPDQYVYGKLTAENQLKYNVITFLMAALPVLYVAIGSLAVAVFYYQVKLRVPIETLKRGISAYS